MQDCDHFWNKSSKDISAFEKFKILSVTGGVPKYLEEIDPHISAEENIRALCFTKGGMLVEEFDNIFANIFLRRSSRYREIVKVLTYGAKEATEISKILSIELTGLFSEYLDELMLSGFIKRDYTWHLKNGHDSKLSKYRLHDNYLRFYLRYIDKHRSKIDRGGFRFKTINALSEWDIVMGLQFENLVLNNRCYIQQALGLTAENIVNDNPFFQKPNSKQRGCQIDYLIQTKFDTLYVCEIKLSKHPIGKEVISSIQKKIDNLKRPKNFSCRPVLIHVNGVSEKIIESNYFAGIIDMSKFLK